MSQRNYPVNQAKCVSMYERKRGRGRERGSRRRLGLAAGGELSAGGDGGGGRVAGAAPLTQALSERGSPWPC